MEDTPTTPLQASALMCYHCFDVLILALQRLPLADLEDAPFIAQLSNKLIECPLFVTWEKQTQNSWQLRGCIGTLSPRPLVQSVGEYALTSAFRDRRFYQISAEEVPNLRVAVSLLVHYEPCNDAYDWTVGVHGILIKFMVRSRDYSATYLPEVAKEQGWDQAAAIASLVQKAGYKGSLPKELIKTIHCTRYQSSKHKVDYQEFVEQYCQGRDPLMPSYKENSRAASSCNIN